MSSIQRRPFSSCFLNTFAVTKSPTLNESNSVVLNASTLWNLPIVGILPLLPTCTNKECPLMLLRGPETRLPSSKLIFLVVDDFYDNDSSESNVNEKFSLSSDMTLTVISEPTWYFA